jgi:hypothetical protein
MKRIYLPHSHHRSNLKDKDNGKPRDREPENCCVRDSDKTRARDSCS